jgi:hypothetical protein
VNTRIVLVVSLLLVATSAGLFYLMRPPAPAPVAEKPPHGTWVGSDGVAIPTRDFLSHLVKATPDPFGPAPQSAPEIQLDKGPLPWEKQLTDILQDPGPDNLKGPRLLALLPNLPEEAYGPATSQALDWLQDADYVSAALPLLLDTHTHGAVQSELFRDVMERPVTISLPALLTIARTPEHPFSQNARENLALLLGEDFDGNWAAWDTAIKQRLAGGQ